MSAARVGPAIPTTVACVVAGLGAAAWMWIVLPQRDAGRDERSTREGLTVRAREISNDFGLNTAGWRATAKLEEEGRSEERFYSDSAHRSTLARPERFAQIQLIDPRNGARQVRVRLGEGRRLLEWEILHNGKPKDEDDDSKEPGAEKSEAGPKPGPALEAQVRTAVQRLAGAEAARFRPLSSRPPEPEGSYELEEEDPATSRLVWQIRLAFQNGRLTKAALQPDVDDTSLYSRVRSHATPGDLRLLGALLVWIAGIGATLAGLQAMRRRSFDWRLFGICAGAIALLESASTWRGALADEYATEFAQGAGSGLWAVLASAAVVAWCAWVVLAAEARSQRYGGSAAWASMRMALAGKLLDARVARGVAAGLGAGAVLAWCRIAPEMLWTPGAQWRALGLRGLSAAPVADALASVAEAGVLAVPLFVLTWGARYRSAWLRASMMLIPVALLAMEQSRSDLSAPLLAASALAGAAVAVALYWLAGALAVAIALPAAAVWIATAATGAPVPGIALVGLCAAGIVYGVRPEEPLDSAWTPVDETDLPSTRREKLKAEFTDAREAQQRLLPAKAPQLDGYEVAAVCIPAEDVGGDLYDFHALPDGRTLFSVADVSGKGMPAALYMTLCKGVLTAACEENFDPRRIAALSNRSIYAAGGRARGQRKVFVTAALAALRPETGEVEIIRAGHNPPLLARASDGTEFLKPPGLAFGMVGSGLFDPRLGAETVTLEPGGTLVLYSDGITEAMDREEDQFGEERLAEALREPGSVQELCARIVEAVRKFAGGAPQHDDMTLVVIRRAG